MLPSNTNPHWLYCQSCRFCLLLMTLSPTVLFWFCLYYLVSTAFILYRFHISLIIYFDYMYFGLFNCVQLVKMQLLIINVTITGTGTDLHISSVIMAVCPARHLEDESWLYTQWRVVILAVRLTLTLPGVGYTAHTLYGCWRRQYSCRNVIYHI